MTNQKTPQFPFYYRDFWHAVRHMTKEETYDYLYLLCEQADSPTGSIPHRIWDKLNPGEEIKRKFELDLNGYFNVRMRDILHKRETYIKSRKSNLKGSHMEPHMGSHMDNDNDNDNDNDIEKGKTEKGKLIKKEPAPPLTFPFTDELFLNRWEAWKEYKKEQFRFTYRHKGEQAALKSIGELSGGSVKKAVAIIEQSMANGWRGLFELKQSFKGNEQYEQMMAKWSDDVLKKHGVK